MSFQAYGRDCGLKPQVRAIKLSYSVEVPNTEARPRRAMESPSVEVLNPLLGTALSNLI